MTADSKKAKGKQRDKKTQRGDGVFSPGTLNGLDKVLKLPVFHL
jgi:hypothetical protein